MGERDREIGEAAAQAAGAVANGVSNVLVAVIDGLSGKGVFSTGDLRAMLDRLESTVRRAEGGIKGDAAQEAEVAVTVAIVRQLRGMLLSDGTPE